MRNEKDFEIKTLRFNGKGIKVSVPRRLNKEERKKNLREMEKLFKQLVFSKKDNQ